jgi:AcrR family transcriptional regulator
MSLPASRKACHVASEQKLAGAQTFRHAQLMATRRDHRRQQTIDEIKDTARSQLADAGPAGISMRAIARHLAMTASAVHYYFPSHQALLDALVVDGFTSLGEALRTTYEGTSRRLPGERWLAVCRAHRAWALDHQAEYLLLYGHDGACTVQQRNSQVEQAFSHVVNVLYSVVGGAVAADEVDTERIEAATPASLRRQLATWRDQNDRRGGLPDGALAACMIAYAQLHGAITLELLGHVPPPLADHGALFDLEMTHAYTALCRQPFT